MYNCILTYDKILEGIQKICFLIVHISQNMDGFRQIIHKVLDKTIHKVFRNHKIRVSTKPIRGIFYFNFLSKLYFC